MQQARAELKKAQTEYAQAKSETAQAKIENEASAQHAAETDQKAGILSQEIEVSHKNEQTLGDKVKKYEPFYLQAHKLWGIMGIILCFGILAAHILILIGFLILLAIATWALSFAFPVIRPFFVIIEAFIKSVFSKIAGLFKKKI